MRYPSRLYVLPLLLLLSSCASLGIAPAESLDQKIAYAQGTDTAVLTASTAALRAGQITADDHEHVIKMAEEVKSILDSAKILSSTEPAVAANKLQLATAVLTQLQTYLNAAKRT